MRDKIQRAMNVTLYVLYIVMVLKLSLMDELKFYIAPKMNFFVYFLILFFSVLIYNEFKTMKANHHSCSCSIHNHNNSLLKSTIVFILLLLPVIAGLLLPTKSLDSYIVERRSLIQHVQEDKKNIQKDSNQTVEEDVILTEKNYISSLQKITNNIEVYKGKNIEMVGFVYHDKESFKESEKFILRYGITCCIADAFPYGVMGNSEQLKDLKDNTWVKIEGEIVNLLELYNQPIIEINNIEIIKEPDNPYVYLEGFNSE